MTTEMIDAPEREDVAETNKRVETVSFLNEGDAKLTTPVTPEGYSTAKHKPLKKSDFECEYIYLEYKANEYDRKAAKLRAEAETIKKLGNATDRVKAKKLMGMQQRMAELARELAAEGSVDLAEILGAEQLAALLGQSQEASS